MKDFITLAQNFTQLTSEFKTFETGHRQLLPKSRKQYENRLKEFAEFLSKFADLQHEIIQLAVLEDQLGNRGKHIDAINIILNKIQFLYMGPLSLELNRRYNVFNTRLAVFSILFGAALGMMQPYIQPRLEKLYKRLFEVTKTTSAAPKITKPAAPTPLKKDHTLIK